jgi:hypothetical protein
MLSPLVECVRVMVRAAVVAGLVLFSGCAATLEQPHVEWTEGDAVSVGYGGTWPIVQAVASSPGGTRKTRLIVDTGCEGVAFSTSLIAALALPGAHHYFAYDGSPVEKGGVGRGLRITHTLARVDLPGACRLEGGEVIGVDMPPGFDVLAGLIAFEDRVVVLDPENARIVFLTRARADLLAADPGAVPLDARRLGNTLRVRAFVEKTVEADLLVDTGARYSWLSPKVAGASDERGRVKGRVVSGRADFGVRTLRVESDGSLEGALGCDVLFGLERPVLLDLVGERVVVLLPGSLGGKR